MQQKQIRDFCIIAHIDHGKSTLVDRLLEVTKTIPERQMQEQFLDQMELERERKITIKAKAIRMDYKAPDGQEYQLNLIDTPGHVDFTYEVSRSLAAVEGAILVVDASQGIQAQTLANVSIAMEHNLHLIPVINKIDLLNAQPNEVAEALKHILGFDEGEIIFASAKEGTGIDKVMQAIIERIPSPRRNQDAPLRALIFDSKYDSYKGVVAFVRIVDGNVSEGEQLKLMSTGKASEALEVGIFKPEMLPLPVLSAGEVGYIATGLKNASDCRVGDTITSVPNSASQALPGYRPTKPMVFAGFYPMEVKDYRNLRDALDKLQLSDAALSYEPESSNALGSGFRCGFLGLLHMDIVRERLEREYGLRILITAPSIAYQLHKRDGTTVMVDNPARLPPSYEVKEIDEPWISVSIITPNKYIGALMELLPLYKGQFQQMEYLRKNKEEDDSIWKQAILKYNMPLSAILVDFHDRLKSCTQGYASLDYTFAEYHPVHLVKLEILVNNQSIDALSRIVHADQAFAEGRALVKKLRQLIPRQLFDVAIQAAVEGKIIARETVKALRKNVLAKCYGGDVTRKRKLLEKQAEGKKRLKKVGKVEIPEEAFITMLKRD
jgi:GTP-binding protein LepA